MRDKSSFESKTNFASVVDIQEFGSSKNISRRYTKNKINQSESEVATGSEYYGGGGGGGMDEIFRRLDNIERQLETRVSKSDIELLEMRNELNIQKQTSELKTFISDELSKLPTEDRVKTIIDEKAKSMDLASKTFVKEQTTTLHKNLIIWFIGIGIGIATLALTAYRTLFK